MAELVGARIQLGIAQTLSLISDGRVIRRQLDLPLEPLLDGFVRRIFTRRIVELDEQLPAPRFAEDFQLADARFRSLGGARKQSRVLFTEPFDGLCGE